MARLRLINESYGPDGGRLTILVWLIRAEFELEPRQPTEILEVSDWDKTILKQLLCVIAKQLHFPLRKV